MKPSLRAKSLTLLASFSLILAIFTGCQTPDLSKLPNQAAEGSSALVAGDTIKVSFPNTPELTQSQRIRADGKVNLPLIGEVSAAGKSFTRFQEELIGRYKPQLKDAEVIVSLESSAIPTVVVAGAVRKGGTIPCERPITVFEAIMQSGGFTPEANLRQVRLFRVVKGEHRSEVLDMRGAMNGAPEKAIYLKGGDIIFVPEKILNF